MIEPLRPLIDEWLWQLFHERLLRVEHFVHDDKACWLGKAGKQHFYEAYYQKVLTLRPLLRRYALFALREVQNAH